jgi:hypothetical protein
MLPLPGIAPVPGCLSRTSACCAKSLTKDLTARDLETGEIVSFVERVEEALAQAARMAKNMTTSAKWEREQIRELYLKKRRANARPRWRAEPRAAEMVF